MSLIEHDPKYVESHLSANQGNDDLKVAYGKPIPNSEEPGYSAIYRNKFHFESLVERIHPSLDTYHNTFQHSVAVHGEDPCFGTVSILDDGSKGPYVFESYNQINQRRRNLGSGIFYVLLNNKFQPSPEIADKIKNHKSVGESFIVSLFSYNRKEWCIADLACSSYSITNTALYDTLGPTTSNYILELTKSPLLLCSKDKIPLIMDLKKNNPKGLVNLTTVVSMDDLDTLNPSAADKKLVADCEAVGLSLYDYRTVEKLGELNYKPEVTPKPETIYTISFTSGTTGANPKGVVLTHANGIASTAFCCVKSMDPPKGKRNYYCFLPLAHIFERMNINYACFKGLPVGFPSTASPLSLLEDVQRLQPGGLLLVPRVLTRLESALKAQTINNDEKPILKYLFTNAVNYKMAKQAEYDGASGSHFFYDKLIGLIRKKIGFQNVISIGTGSAPLSPDTIKFLKAILNVKLSQGYGLTESFAGVCGGPGYEAEPGSCGAPSPTCEMRVKEIPEMNYYVTDAEGPRGELQLRGPQIFKEYYKNPEETRKALSEDGWFSTGDVAQIKSATGRIYIVDRVKNFFKLAQGEYVTPEKIENTYLSCFPLISQIFVHGDSLETYLVAIIGIEYDTTRAWIAKNYKQVLKNEDIIPFMNQLEVKTRFLKAANASTNKLLLGFEKIHNVRFKFEPLKIEDDVITPTMKIKRPICKKFFETELKELYDEGSIIRNEKL